jgi:membrane associated rhomboid family serine protease
MQHEARVSDNGSVQYVGPQPRLGRLFKAGVLALIGLHIGGFLVPVLLPGIADGVVRTFGLSLSSALGTLSLWQFVTHTMVYPAMCQAGSLVGTLLFLLFLGSRFEREWGTARLLVFYVAMALCTGLIRAFAVASGGGIVLGSLGVVCGLLGAYAVLFRGETVGLFFAVIRVEYLVLGLLAILLLLNLRPLDNLLCLTGAVFGYAYARIALRWEARRAPHAAPKGDRFSQIDLNE